VYKNLLLLGSEPRDHEINEHHHSNDEIPHLTGNNEDRQEMSIKEIPIEII